MGIKKARNKTLGEPIILLRITQSVNVQTLSTIVIYDSRVVLSRILPIFVEAF